MTLTGQGAAVCDNEQVIAVAGPAKRELLRKPLSPQLEELVQGKASFISTGENTLPIAQGAQGEAVAAFPVAAAGDPMGAVLLVKGEKSPGKPGSEALESARAASLFLSRQLEV